MLQLLQSFCAFRQAEWLNFIGAVLEAYLHYHEVRTAQPTPLPFFDLVCNIPKACAAEARAVRAGLARNSKAGAAPCTCSAGLAGRGRGQDQNAFWVRGRSSVPLSVSQSMPIHRSVGQSLHGKQLLTLSSDFPTGGYVYGQGREGLTAKGLYLHTSCARASIYSCLSGPPPPYLTLQISVSPQKENSPRKEKKEKDRSPRKKKSDRRGRRSRTARLARKRTGTDRDPARR